MTKTRVAYSAPRIFDGEKILDNHVLLVENGRISGLEAARPDHVYAEQDYHLHRYDRGILSPGFIDLQVNGGGGIMLNDAPTSNSMMIIAEAHRNIGGTTAIFPTLISDTQEQTLAALDAAVESAGSPGIIGLHLEGPHLDPARKGAHLAQYMRPMTDADINKYISYGKRLGKLMLTVAASQVTIEQVQTLTAAGIIVSLGHSEVSADIADTLFDAGARSVTHLFNAMSGISHRNPGLAASALVRGDVWCGIIADGHHVDPRALKIAFASKQSPARLFLVSDAMALVGTKEDSFILNGRIVRRGKSDHCSRLELEDGTLAGSDIDMASSVRYCVEALALPLEQALQAATFNPAAFIGLENERGSFRTQARADIVHLTDKLLINDVIMAA